MKEYRYGRDNLKYWIESLKIDCIDTGVYHYDNQQLKCINQMKPYDKRIQEPINYKNDYTIIHIKREDQKIYPDTMQALDGFRSIAILLQLSSKRLLIATRLSTFFTISFPAPRLRDHTV